MTPKAIAAIALTLIIIVPIGMGYALATEDHEVQVVSTTASHNISDSMLNAEASYYRSSTTAANNAELLTQSSSGVYSVSSPNYVTTSSTYSSLPVYTQEVGHFTPSGVVGRDYDGSIGVNFSGAAYSVTPADYMHFEIMGYTMIKLIVDGSTLVMEGSEYLYAWKCGENYTVKFLRYFEEYDVDEVDEFENVSGFFIGSTSAGETAYEGGDYTQFSLGTRASAAFHPFGQAVALKIVTATGTSYVCSESNALLVLPSSVVFGDQEYYDVEEVYIAGINSMDYTASAPTGTYARPSDGWTLSQSPSFWINNQVNHSATFSVSVVKNSNIIFVPSNWTTTGSETLTLFTTSIGLVKVKSTSNSTFVELGTYSNIQVTVSEDGFTVVGISKWPTMGQKADVLNSVTLKANCGTFTSVKLTGPLAAPFRCDSTAVFAGTYPVTKNYTLDLFSMYRNTQVAVKLNSIGVYGDTIKFGSNAYDVTNGKIAIGDSTYNLKGAMISWDDNGIVCINNKSTGITGSKITFGGEWSLTATAYELKTSTQTVSEWTPGVFALDAGGICAAGLLTAGACMILLGMTGRRSGAKAGLLLLICGGAAAVYLMII